MNAVTWLIHKLVPTDEPADKIVKGVLPDDEKDLRARFLAAPNNPAEKLTPLQERMQSGGA